MLVKEGIPITSVSFVKAVRDGDDRSVLALIKAGIDPSEPDEDRYTPLTHALRADKTEILAILLRNGADPNHADPHGELPLISAVRGRKADAVSALVNSCADPQTFADALFEAIRRQDADVAKILVRHGANLKQQVGPPPKISLLRAAATSTVDIVAVLVEGGAAIDDAGLDGWTPLMTALQNEKFDIATYLVERGANVVHLTVNNNNALSIARHKGNDAIVRLLVEKAKIQNRDGGR